MECQQLRHSHSQVDLDNMGFFFLFHRAGSRSRGLCWCVGGAELNLRSRPRMRQAEGTSAQSIPHPCDPRPQAAQVRHPQVC